MVDETPPKEPKADTSAKSVADASGVSGAAAPKTPKVKAAKSPPPAAAAAPLEGDIVADVPPESDLQSAKYEFPKMHPEGTKFVIIAAAITLALWFIVDWEILGWLMAGVTVWVWAFFRDPKRVTPIGDDLIVSPADGMISHIVTVPAPRQLAANGLLEQASYTRVSVFMNVFDVHVNRAPVAGKISRIVYVPGKFVNAEMDKASEDNERQYFVIEKDDGTRVGMTQIAGLVARRIVKFVREGQGVGVGERIGLIRFGSRVDVFLPEGYAPAVAVGQRAVAGETVLATKGGTAPVGIVN
ncbi:phosphatidylserine decarboxylase [Pacificimonas sp. WHA3]|uniref:Phosphatidylserine decarboxylase proenzyme n=1 Tax=Pacificimonas pallii TaxID=2827236 RepID=A0ABS6SGU3_9SPHN|nr:phosphatidylserine decarboxylase [Pacificimonas pallii]MBV7257072.1 phosphatidylserine decarboxylase [Pacificimonas pallii]